MGKCINKYYSKSGANNLKLSKEQKIIIDHKNKSTSLTNLNFANSKIEFIRVLKSTNFNFFSKDAQQKFFNSEFKVTKLSNRMGMRLEGKKLENIISTNIKSEGLIKGVIQIPSMENQYNVSIMEQLADILK